MTERDSQRDRQTLAVRAGQDRTAEGEHSDPIFATSSFVFENAAQAAARFSESEPGNVYSRFTNPTVRAFEKRLAALESASWGIATASGMSAILLLGLALLRNGDHVVCSAQVFGSTVSLFTKILPRFGIEVDFVPVSDTQAWKSALSKKTRLLFLETPSNPLCEIGDIRALAELAHNANSLLVVDNVYCTPALQRPLEMGADVVIHSATKYLDGQGRCVGGALVTNNEKIHESFFHALRTAGPSMSPFNAWVFHKGLETLPLRMRVHSENAAALAEWLSGHAAVKKVYYPGLADHPGHQLAKAQQEGFGGIVSFEVNGDKTEAWRVIDSTRLLSITANLGDVKTTITHPSSTTHARITAEQRAAAGIGENLVRVAVGLESVADITADLARGLDQLIG
ncbi:MAG TPA: O-succinylhomoserine sulfhydrylase [Alphaproteobacteria bacterium]|nr:O-succinylhomoserine sulfhydrylase [Alphaproteobacteria bacterium]